MPKLRPATDDEIRASQARPGPGLRPATPEESAQATPERGLGEQWARAGRLVGQSAQDFIPSMVEGLGSLPGLAYEKIVPNMAYLHGLPETTPPENRAMLAERGRRIAEIGGAPGRAFRQPIQEVRQELFGPDIRPEGFGERMIAKIPQVAASAGIGALAAGPGGAVGGALVGLFGEMAAAPAEEGTAAILKALGEDPDAWPVMMAVVPMAVDLAVSGPVARAEALSKLGQTAAGRIVIQQFDDVAADMSRRTGRRVTRENVLDVAADLKSKVPTGNTTNPETLADAIAARRGLPGADRMTTATIAGEEGGQNLLGLQERLAQDVGEASGLIKGRLDDIHAANRTAFDEVAGPAGADIPTLQRVIQTDVAEARKFKAEAWAKVPLQEMPRIPVQRVIDGADEFVTAMGRSNLPDEIREFAGKNADDFPGGTITMERLQQLRSDLLSSGRTGPMSTGAEENIAGRARKFQERYIQPIIDEIDARTADSSSVAYQNARQVTREYYQRFPEESVAFSALMFDENPVRAAKKIAGAKNATEEIRNVRKMLGDDDLFRSFGRAYVEELMGGPDVLRLSAKARKNVLTENRAAILELYGEDGYQNMRRIVESRWLAEYGKAGTRGAAMSVGSGRSSLDVQTIPTEALLDPTGTAAMSFAAKEGLFRLRQAFNYSENTRRRIWREALFDSELGELLLRAPVDAAQPAWRSAVQNRLVATGILDAQGREIVHGQE